MILDLCHCARLYSIQVNESINGAAEPITTTNLVLRGDYSLEKLIMNSDVNAFAQLAFGNTKNEADPDNV